MARARADALKFGLILCTVFQGCGGDGGDGGNGGTPPNTTAIAKAAADNGDAQSGTVAQPLASPLRVTVTQDGTPLAGAAVTWSTTATGGSVNPSSAVTDASGVASTTWTLGTVAGAQSAQAALSGASGSPVGFTATAAPGAASELEQVSGDAQQGAVGTALPNPLVAKVSDQFGNGVAGVDVAWTATDGSLSAPTVPTAANGTSAVTLTLGDTEGPITITATSGTLAGSPQTFTATATAAPAPSSNIAVVNDAFQPSTLTVPAGTTVTWTWGSGASQHNVVPVATEPASSGAPANAPHTYQFTFNTPGTYNYYCQVHGSPTFGMRGTVVVE